jgi:hypothetical protein
MKCWTALVFGCSIGMVAQTQAADNASLERWAGCYELRVAREDAGKQIWGKLPHRFQLLTQKANHKRLILMRGRVLGGEILRWPFTFWSVSEAGELKIEWGFMTGYVVRLTKSGNQLVGSARAFTDDGNPMPTLKVRVRQISCRQESATAYKEEFGTTERRWHLAGPSLSP